MPIHLYVEHLINIRTLAIQASLSSASNQETKATLSSANSILTLTHEGESASIHLPVNVGGGGDATLTLPSCPTKDLGLRLAVEERPDGAGFLQGGPRNGETVTPWSASGLSEQSEFYCRSCDACLLPRGQIRMWKDLPSEGWAEMMEFWHCHKPHEPDSHEHGSGKKGYAADTALTAVSSVGLVSTTSFLLAAEDCQNTKVSDSDSTLLCSTCTSPIGIIDAQTHSHKLLKQTLALSSSPERPPGALPTEKWLSCHLLDAIDNQGVRKFTVTASPAQRGPGQDDTSGLGLDLGLQLWIFTPDLNISSSTHTLPEPLRCAKVLYKPLPAPSADSKAEVEKLDQRSLSEGEITIPAFQLQALKACLEESGLLLPESARVFQGWNVGLLQRFGEGEA